MRTSVTAALCLLTAIVQACGPAAGDRCSGEGFACDDEVSALECRQGLWTAIPCKGPGGCSTADWGITCDMSLNAEGDACPLAAENQGLCEAPDHLAVLECHGGLLVQTRTCSSCTVVAEQVQCVP